MLRDSLCFWELISMLPGRSLVIARRMASVVLRPLLRPLFAKCGRHVRFDPFGSYSFSTIEIGDYVYIGNGARFSSRNATITIGNKVMFGPNVTIRGGDHNTGEIGRFMYDVKEKRCTDDQPVIIDDDVWVGTCAVILKGVHIRRGTVVAAGAVVTRSTPPYAIVGGVPAQVLKYRWDTDAILKHERLLYPPEQRLSREELEESSKPCAS